MYMEQVCKLWQDKRYYCSWIFKTICVALRDFVPFVQFKKCEKHSSIGVFHVFKIVQMVSNRAKHPICYEW